MSSALAVAGADPSVAARAPWIDDRAFFDRSAADLAPDLLGMTLIHETTDGLVVGRIVEVEAYLGPEDLAAHSAHGMTPRNAAMFGPPGHAYVYLVYGLHHCLNIVAGPAGKPEAVLLRAAEVTEGAGVAAQRRSGAPSNRLASGPGNLARAFGVGRSLDGADLLSGPLRLAPGRSPAAVRRTPRIGVPYAGEWVNRPLRYLIADDPHRSRP
jgi:DNA-3-methyladenine glycosylase